jgi:hypothetical protein
MNATTAASPKLPLLVIDLDDEDASAPFRCLPKEVVSIESNLSIANMDFFEFADSADADGVYREPEPLQGLRPALARPGWILGHCR